MSQDVIHNSLFTSIKALTEQSKQQVALSVNTTMSMLYWQIGKQILATLWRQLVAEYRASFSEKNLRRMMQFAAAFPDEKIFVSLIRQSITSTRTKTN